MATKFVEVTLTGEQWEILTDAVDARGSYLDIPGGVRERSQQTHEFKHKLTTSELCIALDCLEGEIKYQEEDMEDEEAANAVKEVIKQLYDQDALYAPQPTEFLEEWKPLA